MFLTCSFRSGLISLCSLRKSNSKTWCFQCDNIGCFALKSYWFLPILPLARIISLFSRKSENCIILLFFRIFFQPYHGISFFFNSKNFCCRFHFAPCLVHIFNCNYRPVEIAKSLPRNDLCVFFGCGYEGCLFAAFVRSECWIHLSQFFFFLVASTRLSQWATHCSWVHQWWWFLPRFHLGCRYLSHDSTVKRQWYQNVRNSPIQSSLVCDERCVSVVEQL